MHRFASRTALALLLAAAATQAVAAPASYAIDPTHTDVYVSWDYLGFARPSAHLGEAEGVVVYDADNPRASSVEVTLSASSLDGHVERLNQRLLRDDYLDADKHPTISFRSTSVEPAGENRLKVSGDLTIRGVTRPVVLDAVLNKVGKHPARDVAVIGFDATATVKRSEFGIIGQLPHIADDLEVAITVFAQGQG